METIPPHRYPALVKLFAGLLALTLAYALFLLPGYFRAAKKLRAGITAYNNGDFSTAIEDLHYVIEKTPTSRQARIFIAEGYFASGNATGIQGDYVRGFRYLKGLTLNDDEWLGVKEVLPAKYQKYFTETK